MTYIPYEGLNFSKTLQDKIWLTSWNSMELKYHDHTNEHETSRWNPSWEGGGVCVWGGVWLLP
jgi:hypothetical protein